MLQEFSPSHNEQDRLLVTFGSLVKVGFSTYTHLVVGVIDDGRVHALAIVDDGDKESYGLASTCRSEDILEVVGKRPYQEALDAVTRSIAFNEEPSQELIDKIADYFSDQKY